MARSLRVLVLDPYHAEIIAALRARVSAEVALEGASAVAEIRDGASLRVCLGRPDLVAEAAEVLPALEWLQSTWAGVAPLLPLLRSRADLVASAPRGIFGDAIAEYVLGWLLALDRRLLDYGTQQLEGSWAPLPDRGLAGRKVLLLGTGSIGRRVAERLAFFGMEVVGVSRRGEQVAHVARTWPTDQRLVAARNADVVVNTLPETVATRGIVDADLLGVLARDAVLINVGRGSAVDEAALLAALGRRLRAAVLDVFETEPLPGDHPFWTTPNLHLTPHVAAVTRPKDIAQLFAANLAQWRAGRPPDALVDPRAGY